jgi:hypothetical protein
MGPRAPLDFVWTALGVPIIVSDHVISILNANRFRGWKTYAIQLFGKDAEPIGGYHGLAISGRCGPLQPERSQEVVTKRADGQSALRYKGWYFDETKWDGSHIFMPSSGTGLVFVMQEVRDALRAGQVKGVLYTPAATHERVIR